MEHNLRNTLENNIEFNIVRFMELWKFSYETSSAMAHVSYSNMVY